MTSQNTKFNPATHPSGKQGSLRSSMTVFSDLLSPSVSKDAPSMKLNLPKGKSRYTRDTSTLRIKAFSPTLYDDPAFSPDPHAHPFFTTSHDGWTSPPMVGHPTLRKDAHRPPHLVIPPVIRDSGEFRLIQPPNSPMSDNGLPTNPSSYTSPLSPHLNTDTSKATVATATRSQSAPSLVQSHQANNASISDEQLRSPVEKLEKKRNPLALFWRKSPPTSPTDKPVDPEPKHHDEAPPSYETIFSDPPSSVTSTSTRTETQSSTDVSSLATQSTMVSADSQQPSRVSRPRVGKYRNRRNKLDRIDELDESNPLGVPVHHGGPYEAIQRSVQPQSRRSDPYNVGSQYPISTGSAQSSSSKVGSSESNSNPHTPSSVSLNLSPGEILPRNLTDYYNPYIQSTGVINTPPVPNPPSNSRHRLAPSLKRNPHERRDQPQQRRQEQIPNASTSAQFPEPPHTRPTGIPQIVNFQNIPARAVPSREVYNHDPRQDFDPPMPAPPPPRLPTGGRERYNQVHPSREGDTYNFQHGFHPPIPAPPPPLSQLPGDRHEHYNQGNLAHPSRDGFNDHRQADLRPIQAPPPPPAQLPAGGHERYNHGHIVHPSREGFNYNLQRELHPAMPAPNSQPAQSLVEHYDQGIVHPSREGHIHGPHHDFPLSIPAPPPPPAQLVGGHERYNQGNTVHPPREGYIHGPQYDVHSSISAPLPPGQLSVGVHEHYNQSNMTHPPNPELKHRVDVRPPMPGRQPQQSRDHDAQSTQRSITSNGSTFNSRNGATHQPPPPRHHLPKKLVMPAPLQSSLPTSPRDQSHLLPSHHRFDVRDQPQHFPSRPSSPPSSLHPSFNSLMPRVQDIPVPQGRKLRKQGSINGLPRSATNNQSVSFPANVGYSDPRPPAPTSAPSKTAKAPKRLLSKRRTDL